MNQMGRNVLMWVAIGFLLVFFYNSFMQQGGLNGQKITTLSYSAFMSDARQGQVSDITINGQNVTGTLSGGEKFKTVVPVNENIVDRLGDAPVEIKAKAPDEGFSLIGILLSWFPMLLLIGVWIFFMKKMGGGGAGGAGGAFSFGKSKAKLLTEHSKPVTFADVAGIDEAKEELVEIVEFLKDPKKFERLGGKIPKGALLVGPPGTGKTLTARAVAGEASVPFFSISGSDFVEMFVGVGASRVRDMFEQGKKNAPCIIFIDEIDAVGRSRGSGMGGGNDEREQTLNQMLVEMDGFEASEGVIIIAATNRPDVLDPALLRPGRFDRQITIPNPDVNGREMILQVHSKDVPLAKNVDLRVIARGTPGFSGADLANLINEGALLAARRGKRVIAMQELEDAKDKVMMGTERRSMAMSEEEKKLTAYHEAGHAIIALHEPASDPIHKATIIPRGRALGMVMRLPDGDKLSLTRAKLHADLAVAMGGRVAEEIIFGHDMVTTGASSDIKQATHMARKMVTEWGMSDKVGPVDYGDEDQNFLGQRMANSGSISDDKAKLIDSEIKALVDYGYNQATKLLKKHSAELELLAQGLLEYETLSGAEIKELIETGKVDRSVETSADVAAARAPRSSVPPTVPKPVKKAAEKKKAVTKKTNKAADKAKSKKKSVTAKKDEKK
jgi:cell division protease FtsH